MMELREFLGDREAMTPVIGIILVVAVAVILASIIGTFALGLGDEVRNAAPQATFEFDWNETSNNLNITHQGGDRIVASELEVTNGTTVGCDSASDWGVSEKVGASDNCVYNHAYPDDTVRVNWRKEGNTATLVKWEGPDA